MENPFIYSTFKGFNTTDPALIVKEMEEVVKLIKSISSEDEEAAIMIVMTASLNFVRIHPFQDATVDVVEYYLLS